MNQRNASDATARLASGPFVRLTVANTLFFLCFASFSFFLLPVWLTRLGADPSTIGVVMAAGPAASMGMMPLVGALVDRWGRRRPFMVGGYLGLATVAFAFSRVDAFDPWLFVGLRVLGGLSFSAGFTVANVWITDAVPLTRLGQGIGLFGVFILVSHVLGPMLAEPLAHRFGFPRVFGMAAFLPLVAIAILPSERSAPRRSTRRSGGMLATLGNGGFRAVLALTVAAGAGFALAVTYVPTYSEKYGIKPVATFFAGYALAAIAVRIVAGRLSDVEPRLRVIQPTALGFVLALVLVPTVGSWPGMAAVGTLFGVSHGLMYPTVCALALERVDEPERGTAMVLYNLAFNVGSALTMVVAGTLIEHLGYGRAFPAVAASVAAVALCFVARERRVLRPLVA